MKCIVKNKFFLVIFSIYCFLGNITAQEIPQGITYQGLARNASDSVISNQMISLKIGIYSPTVSGTLEWEETHSIITNQFGLIYCIIGQGISTGAGSKSSFSMISWGAGAHFVKIAMDETGGSTYVNIDTIQFWSVPYAMNSETADSLFQPLRLSELVDVDTLGVYTGAVLKWNGSLWQPAADNNSDTALYSINAGHSDISDTALYAVNVLSSIDTIPFAYLSDSALFSVNSQNAVNSLNSNYCDTAVYALNVGNAGNFWNINGNSGTTPALNFLGTTDNTDLVFKTNNAERMRITSAGKIGIGTSTPIATLHVAGNDGIIAEGTFGTGTAPPSGIGTRMIWYPKKAAFRAGGVSSNQWDDIKIGNYSFSSGYNTTASGAYSTAFGSGSTSSGQYSLAACELSTASGISSVAMGSSCVASGAYAVALGRGSQATDSSSIAMGYHPTASGKYSVSLGYTTIASGDYSVVLGYAANSNNKRGSFVYADASSNIATNSTADNQFMVRASGGAIFYSNAGLTTGVTLAAGSGSWSSVSDKNKKENFKNENPENVLNNLRNLEIYSWNYKTQSASIRHIGPFAQDFYSIFKLGESDTTITTVDIDGISLIAIQALSKKTLELKKKSEEIEMLRAHVERLEKEKRNLEKRIEHIESKIKRTDDTFTVLKEN
jgi:hypothetical protein